MNEPITPTEAEARNLRPLTTTISKREIWIAENILADMRRGGIDAAVVTVNGGSEVWRSNNGWRENTKS